MRLLSCIGIVCALALGIVPEARARNVFGSRSVFGPPVFFSPYLPSPAQGAPGSPPAAAGGMRPALRRRRQLPPRRPCLPGFLMPRDQMLEALIRALRAVLLPARRARINPGQGAVQAKRIMRASKRPKLRGIGIRSLRHAPR